MFIFQQGGFKQIPTTITQEQKNEFNAIVQEAAGAFTNALNILRPVGGVAADLKDIVDVAKTAAYFKAALDNYTKAKHFFDEQTLKANFPNHPAWLEQQITLSSNNFDNLMDTLKRELPSRYGETSPASMLGACELLLIPFDAQKKTKGTTTAGNLNEPLRACENFLKNFSFVDNKGKEVIPESFVYVVGAYANAYLSLALEESAPNKKKELLEMAKKLLDLADNNKSQVANPAFGSSIENGISACISSIEVLKTKN